MNSIISSHLTRKFILYTVIIAVSIFSISGLILNYNNKHNVIVSDDQTNCYQEVSSPLPADIQILLDVSNSMNQRLNNQTRIYYAKEATKTLLDTLQAQGVFAAQLPTRISIITYQSFSETSLNTIKSLDEPLDINNLKIKIDAIRANGNTPFKDAINQAKTNMATLGRSNVTKVTIIVSDGLPFPSGTQTPTPNEIEAFKAVNDKVYGINIGDSDQSLMQSLSKPIENFSSAFANSDASKLTDLYNSIIDQLVVRNRTPYIDLEIKKTVRNTDDTLSFHKDDTIVYTLAVTNKKCQQRLNTVKVEDILPNEITYQSSYNTTGGRRDLITPTDNTYTINQMDPNRQYKIEIYAKINISDGPVSNTSTVTTPDINIDIDPDNNTSAVDFLVTNSNAIDVTGGNIAANDTINGINISDSALAVGGTPTDVGGGNQISNYTAGASQLNKATLTNQITAINNSAYKARTIASGSDSGSWNLNSSSSSISDNIVTSASSPPEGQLWKFSGNKTLPAGLNIAGRGTIIIDGILTIDSSVTCGPTSQVAFIADSIKIENGADIGCGFYLAKSGDINMSAVKGGSLKGIFIALNNIVLPAKNSLTSNLTIGLDGYFRANPTILTTDLLKIVYS